MGQMGPRPVCGGVCVIPFVLKKECIVKVYCKGLLLWYCMKVVILGVLFYCQCVKKGIKSVKCISEKLASHII